MEVPMDAVVRAARLGREAGAIVCLDPAPAALLPDDLWPLIDVINPNEIEARLLTGLPVGSLSEAERAAEALLQRGRALRSSSSASGARFMCPPLVARTCRRFP